MKESPFKKGYYEVDFGLTLLFNQIYGEDEYSKFKENATLSKYKSQFSKLITTIGKSFSDTCKNTDNFHLKEIDELIASQISLIKEKKTLEKLYQSLIIFFPKLCFLLIGRIPQNGIKRKKDNRSTWNLSEFRQIEYKQIRIQKLELLLELLKNERIEGLGSYRTELKNYESNHLENENFMNWFMRTYQEIYLDIFERTE